MAKFINTSPYISVTTLLTEETKEKEYNCKEKVK